MIRDLICPLLFQKYLKMMSRQTAVLLKKSISDDYIAYLKSATIIQYTIKGRFMSR